MSTEVSASEPLVATARQRQVLRNTAADIRRAERVMNEPKERPIVVAPSRYVLLKLATLITGYTVKAMESKISRGYWREGREWRHEPDGRVLIDLHGYQRWVEDR